MGADRRPSRADRAAATRRDVDACEAAYRRGPADRHGRLAREFPARQRAGRPAGRPDAGGPGRIIRAADEDFRSGAFLIERLGGGGRHLDPQLTAALLVLRRHLSDEHGAQTAAELLPTDLAPL